MKIEKELITITITIEKPVNESLNEPLKDITNRINLGIKYDDFSCSNFCYHFSVEKEQL